MKYVKSEKYNTPDLMKKIMGPNPIKLEEELLLNNKIPENAVVCDLGSGQGLTSVFLPRNTASPYTRRICGAIRRKIALSSMLWASTATD